MTDLLRALSLSIGNAALDTHRRTCEVCSDDHDCVVAKAHLGTIRDLSTPPGQGASS